MHRSGNRKLDALRKVKITKDVMKYAEGSCLIEVGNTRVVCTASCEEKVPLFLRGKSSGWVSAEYGMLPRSCRTRITREASTGKLGGRTQEIQRLIGRSLRAVVDMEKLGERTIWIDCDVLQADGGTRTASITASFVALAQALGRLKQEKKIEQICLRKYLAAVSVGMVDGKALLDLDYEEDSRAQVDMNIVMTSDGEFIELQGTAEKQPFTSRQLQQLIALGSAGVKELIAMQRKILKDLPLNIK